MKLFFSLSDKQTHTKNFNGNKMNLFHILKKNGNVCAGVETQGGKNIFFIMFQDADGHLRTQNNKMK